MSQITIKANFAKQSKDSKKEQATFWVSGDDERNPNINTMTREVVMLSIEGIPVELKAEFVKSSKDAKKTVLEFVVKGDSSATNTFEFYKQAGKDIILTIKEAQTTLDEFTKEREGLEYRTDENGVVTNVNSNQMSIDEIDNSPDPLKTLIRDRGDDKGKELEEEFDGADITSSGDEEQEKDSLDDDLTF